MENNKKNVIRINTILFWVRIYREYFVVLLFCVLL